tara:strand:- start:5 stop:238 length:234 start_codon:yes stop_codon:yes gene_type:complete
MVMQWQEHWFKVIKKYEQEILSDMSCDDHWIIQSMNIRNRELTLRLTTDIGHMESIIETARASDTMGDRRTGNRTRA